MMSDNTGATRKRDRQGRGVTAFQFAGMSDKTCSLTFLNPRSAEGFINQCFPPAYEGSDASRFTPTDCVQGRDCGLTVSCLCECLSGGGNGKAVRADRVFPMEGSALEPLDSVLESSVDQVGIDLRGGKVPVAQGALDHQDIPGAAVEVGGESVAKPMRAELFFDPRCPEPLVEPSGHLALAETAPAVGEEKRPAFLVAETTALFEVSAQEGAKGGL